MALFLPTEEIKHLLVVFRQEERENIISLHYPLAGVFKSSAERWQYPLISSMPMEETREIYSEINISVYMVII